MRLKNLNETPHEGFTFFYWNLQKEYMQVKANGVPQLVVRSAAQMRNQGMDVPENLREIVEHQICLRQPDPKKACWNDGAGDFIHQDVAKPVLKGLASIAKAVGLKKVAKAIKKKSSCSSCGGSKVYKQGENALGRAGALNKVFNIPKNKS